MSGAAEYRSQNSRGREKPEEYGSVRLLRPIPEHNLPAGAIGTVVMDHTKYGHRGLPPAYEVEFMDSHGHTEAVVTVSEEFLEVI
nr:DUF4926 domain-containing protein [Mycolicibacterium houstonense]